MDRDAGDIVDRYSIALLKWERTKAPTAKDEVRYMEYGFLELRKRFPWALWTEMLGLIKEVNGHIWDLESEMRQGKLDGDLVETGRRAILIRKFNGVRVRVKNLVNLMTGEGVQDVKIDHLSQQG